MTSNEFTHFYTDNWNNFLYWLRKAVPEQKQTDYEDAIADAYFKVLEKVEAQHKILAMRSYCQQAIRNRMLQIVNAKEYHVSPDDIYYDVPDKRKDYDYEKWLIYDCAWSQLDEKGKGIFKQFYYENKKVKDFYESYGYNTQAACRKALVRFRDKFKAFYETCEKKLAF